MKGKRRLPRPRVSARGIALIVTAALLVAGITVAVIVGSRPSSAPLGAASSAALPGPSRRGNDGSRAAPDPTKPVDLERAADAVGFRVTLAADAGRVELLPADVVLPAPSRSLLPVGSVAPNFALSTPDGRVIRLSDFRGRTVLLEFLATWCSHCQAEAPHLLQLYAERPSPDIVFLSLNADSEDAASVLAFSRHFAIPWPALLDPGTPPGSFRRQGGIGPVSRAYGIALFPTFYIIDPGGRVAWRGDREQPDALLRERLRDGSGL